jgi:hypothetical protein
VQDRGQPARQRDDGPFHVLYEAAKSMLAPSSRWSWAMQIAKRRGSIISSPERDIAPRRSLSPD